MMSPKPIKLDDYLYELPQEKIAQHPLEQRDLSKCLILKDETIQHTQFKDILNHLPDGADLFCNNTKVIPARLIFYKETGARIEIFLLNPISPTKDYHKAMWVKGQCQWQCMVGNSKKWKKGILSTKNGLKAELSNREAGLVTFSFDKKTEFIKAIEEVGNTPLPPYIKREANEKDKDRYQTVYSKEEGAVAAPTAGLHFTDEIIHSLAKKNISYNQLTLHVSAGTFQPIKVDDVLQHPMHEEQIVLTKKNIERLLHSKNVIAVGTTSMRSLESSYWYGVKLLKEKDEEFYIEKLYPYQHDKLPSLKESMQAILDKMNKSNIDTLHGRTEIFIMPGYQFKVCEGLITNFHMPGTTLILLVAAFIGESWKKVYQEALDKQYRFLSFGDSSLLFRN